MPDDYNKAELYLSLNSQYGQSVCLWKKGVRFFRAAEDHGDWYVMRPQYRTSTDTGNEYTFLISELLPSWRGFPKRNCCIIAAGRKSSAEEYLKPGRILYCVLPEDGAYIAVAPAEDMWDSFPYLRRFGITTIHEFNNRLASVLSSICSGEYSYSKIREMFYSSNAHEILALFDMAERRVKNGGAFINSGRSESLLSSFIISGVEQGRAITVLLDELLSPVNNGFAVSPVAGIGKADTEIWTDAKCLLIRQDIASDILTRA